MNDRNALHNHATEPGRTPRIYSSRTEAIHYEITEAIRDNLDAFDLDRIADATLAWDERAKGFYMAVTATEFWRTVEANEIPTQCDHPGCDDYDKFVTPSTHIHERAIGAHTSTTTEQRAQVVVQFDPETEQWQVEMEPFVGGFTPEDARTLSALIARAAREADALNVALNDPRGPIATSNLDQRRIEASYGKITNLDTLTVSRVFAVLAARDPQHRPTVTRRLNSEGQAIGPDIRVAPETARAALEVCRQLAATLDAVTTAQTPQTV